MGHELDRDPLPPLHRSRGIVARLSALFALDSFGGGFVVQSFIAYWFALKFGTTHQELAILFLAIGFLQAASFQIAVRLAGRIGLLRTMVFTHLPSNVLLAAIAFAPTYAVAVVLLLARYALSQMDVPARQAYVAAVVDPSERTAAAAYTNTARYVTRPIGPLVGGAALTIALGAPFVIAGAVKSVYDVALLRDVPGRRRSGTKPSARARRRYERVRSAGALSTSRSRGPTSDRACLRRRARGAVGTARTSRPGGPRATPP